MNKQSTTAGSNGLLSRIRSLLAFRHQNPVARLVSIVAAFATAMMLAVGIGPAYAVHDTGMFELDGNIAHDSATTPPYDWGNLFDASGARTVTPNPDIGPLLASGFQTDTDTPDTSYFSGSTKDEDSIASWTCGPANNPLDKDDLQHAYAALIHVPIGAPDNADHDVLYLGSDRLGNNGDAFAGFWLLKDPNVGCTSGSFSGHHTDGDRLIVSDYTNGGNTEHVKVFKWVGNDATGHLELDADYNPSQCGDLAPDNACADANDVTINAPWRSGIAQNEFVESGIDMTHLLGGAAGCFTTFLAETRTSQSIDAELKDFTGGQFDTCPPPPITTSANPGGTLNAPGSAQHDDATVHAVGSRPTPAGSIAFYLCGPSQITAGQGCPTGGTLVSTNDLDNGSVSSDEVSGATTTPLGKYCWRAEYTPNPAGAQYYVASSHTNDDTECFTVVHASPTITTQIAPAAGGDPLGLGFTTLSDTAQLHGFVGSVTGETVTFKLYGPFVGAVPTDCTSGPLAATRTGTLNLTGQASTTTPSASFAPTAAGTYIWIASYPGDTLNDPVDGQCDDANETATIVAAHINVVKSATAGSVSAGSAIGFDITVSNVGTVPATGVHVIDNLPAGADGVFGGDLDWSLVPPYTGCLITGAVGTQVLDCSLGTVGGATTLPAIHVEATTSPADCGTVKNKASVSTTNGTGGDSDFATVSVLCPGLHITKEADAASVNVGTPIGFTVTATNNGAGTATGVLVHDALPTGPGITWAIDTTVTPPSGPLTCGIADGTGADLGHQVLTCTGSLGAGLSEVVHVTSPTQWTGSGETEVNSCLGGTNGTGVYDNTAEVSASNVIDSPSASAQEQVLCPALDLTKVADAAVVDAGTSIGFTITAKNTGAGSATGAVINDPLPGNVTWTIDVAHTSGPLTCGISGATLSCTGTLGSGATEAVHITATTTRANCATYNNTATLTANFVPGDVASASTTVLCPVIIVSPPQVSPPNVLPNTGGPDLRLLAAGLALVLGGSSLVLTDRRRRRRS